MSFLIYQYNNSFQRSLINRFNYKDKKKIPTLEKIVLNISCNDTDFHKIVTSLLAIEFIANQEGKITKSKENNILLKIRKGNPVGCKVTLRNRNMFEFLYQFNCNILPKSKNFTGFEINSTENTFTYHFENLFLFERLEKQFQLFNTIKHLSISIVTSANNKNELIFILKQLNLPFKQ